MKRIAKTMPVSINKGQPQHTFQTTHIPILTPMNNLNPDKDPLIELDFEMKCDSTKYNTRLHVKNNIIEHTPPLPSPNDISFQNIFDRKIKACLQTCNFGYADAEASVKEKETLLNHFLTFFESSKNAKSLSVQNVTKLLEMIKVNIVRKIDCIERIAFISEDNPNVAVREWPHLQIIYRILQLILKYYYSYIQPEFAVSIVSALNSTDEKERFQVKEFLINYCNKNPESQSFVLIPLLKSLVDYGNNLTPPFGIASTLELIKTLTQNLGGDISFLIFSNYILPLLKTPQLSFFYKEMVTTIQFFMCCEQRNVTLVIDYLLKYFPYTIMIKQVYFLNLLTETIPKLSQRDFSSRINKIFAIYSRCSKSPSSKIADTALNLWQSLEMQAIIKLFAVKIFPIALPPLFYIVQEHWCQSVRQNAQKAIDFANKTDKKIVLDIQSKSRNGSIYSNIESEESKTWAKLAELASARDKSFNAQKIINAFNEMVFPEKSKQKTKSSIFNNVKNGWSISSSLSITKKPKQFEHQLTKNPSAIIIQPKLCYK